MILFLKILFWTLLAIVIHTYWIYPMVLRLLARHKKNNDLVYSSLDDLPNVCILMAAYNEQQVIAQKIDSIIASRYPAEKWTLWIGSDGSTDATNAIVQQYTRRYPQIQLQHFGGRNGKPNIINQLAAQVLPNLPDNSIFLLTDANVLFTPSTIAALAQHFANPQIGIVGANILNILHQQSGISQQEQYYIQRENNIKYLEGITFGTVIGTFGGCFALRAKLFSPVPANYIVDDFYLTMAVLEQHYAVIQEPAAICYEDVSDSLMEEFRRKKRISAGNFQNLARFSHLLFSSNPKGLAFCFWSHKVWRWLTPFFLIIIFIVNIILAPNSLFYRYLLYIQLLVISLPLLDVLLSIAKIHFSPTRYIRYFYMMNIALLIGFFNYIKGVQTNVWKPTQRNQTSA